MDSIFVNVLIKNHSSFILGLNTYEVKDNEVTRTMENDDRYKIKKDKTIEMKIYFKDIEQCVSNCN